MDKQQILPELTKAEFDILRIIWKSGRLNVREVHDQLTGAYTWAYSTTKTMMDRMVKKNLLKREQFHGIFLYKAVVSRPAGLARMIEFFADRVLETDYSTVVSLFAKSNSLSDKEILELKDLIKENKAEKDD